MNYLILDTSGKRAVLVARHHHTVRTCIVAPYTMSSAVVAMADSILKEAGLTPRDLTFVSAVVGPGSFTGVRIGVSFINGFARALNLPMLPISALEAMQMGEPQGTLSAIPSRADFCYTLHDGVTAERTNGEIAAIPSVGFEGSGATHLLSLNEYALRLDAYATLHSDSASRTPLVPMYLKKSQAERLKQ